MSVKCQKRTSARNFIIRIFDDQKTLRYRFWQLVDRTHEATVAILRGKRMEEHPLQLRSCGNVEWSRTWPFAICTLRCTG
jgi:hypothetical protein